MNKERVRDNFSAAAKTYETHAHIQRQITEDIFRHLPRAGIRRILDVGCGSGGISRRLETLYPHSSILGIDFAPGMIGEARSLSKASRVEFRLMDGEDINALPLYDLIFSNATFQWFDDLERSFQAFSHHLTSEGILAFSLFLEETFLRVRRPLERIKPGYSLSPPLPSFPQIEAFLKDTCLTPCHHSRECLLRSYPTLNDFIANQRATGSLNPLANDQKQNLTRLDIEALKAEIQGRDGVLVDYHYGVFIYRKSPY